MDQENHYTCEAFFQDCLENNKLDQLKYAHEHFGIIDREWHLCGSQCFGIRGCLSKDENLLDAAIWYNNTEMADWLFTIGMTVGLLCTIQHNRLNNAFYHTTISFS